MKKCSKEPGPISTPDIIRYLPQTLKHMVYKITYPKAPQSPAQSEAVFMTLLPANI